MGQLRVDGLELPMRMFASSTMSGWSAAHGTNQAFHSSHSSCPLAMQTSCATDPFHSDVSVAFIARAREREREREFLLLTSGEPGFAFLFLHTRSSNSLTLLYSFLKRSKHQLVRNDSCRLCSSPDFNSSLSILTSSSLFLLDSSNSD